MSDDQTKATDVDDKGGEAKEEFVPKAEFEKLRKNHEIVRRKLTKAQEKQLSRSDLLADPEFRMEALGKWEIPHDDEGNFKLPENLKDAEAIENEYKTRLQQANEKWTAKNLKPLQEQLDAFQNENSVLKNNTLIASLERSAKRAGVVDSKFKPNPFDNKTAPVHLAKDRFRWNPDIKAHVLMHDAETMELDNTGDPVTADKYFEYFFDAADEDTKREWLGDQRQRGSGFNSKGQPRGAYVMSREEAKRSPSMYRARKAAAKKDGQKLTLVD